jgi:hypothetical protein
MYKWQALLHRHRSCKSLVQESRGSQAPIPRLDANQAASKLILGDEYLRLIYEETPSQILNLEGSELRQIEA